MLQIRLNKGSAIDGGAGAKPAPSETVTVACPDHLILADLPVAKGLGSATSASTVKIVGRRSRRQLGERVHFCVRCDFPISIYGRLSPCEHAFCLDCARSDSICYLCDERIQKIQTIKMMEGIFICAAPHCLKSFLKKTEFESHIHNCHNDLLQPNQKKDESNEPDSSALKQSSNMDSTSRAQPRPGSGFPPSLNSQQNDREDKGRRQQPKDQTPPPKQSNPPQYYSQAHPSDPRPDNMPIGLEGFVHGRMQQQNLDAQSGMPQDFGQFSDKQQGMLPDPSHQDYPSLYPQQLPNFPIPVNSNPMLMAPPPFGFPPFPSDGAPPFFGGPAPFEVARSDSTAETGSDSGPGPGPGGVGFPEGYAWPWGGPPGNVPFEAMQGGQGVMPPPPPPPGPPPHHLLQHKHGYHSGGDIGNDGNKYGWHMDRRDSFGSGRD